VSARLVRVAVVAGVLGLAVPVVTARAVPPSCVAEDAPWRWRAVDVPDRAPVVAVDQFDEDPCRMLAVTASDVWVSADGGARWLRRLSLATPAVGLFTERMGERRALVALQDGGVLLTTDGGETFTSPLFLSANGVPRVGGDVVAATAGQTYGTTRQSRNVLVSVRSPVPGVPTLYGSTDGGATFRPRSSLGLWEGAPVPPMLFTRLFVDDASGWEYAVSAPSQDGDPRAGADPAAARMWFHLGRQWDTTAPRDTWHSDTINGSSPSMVQDAAMVPVAARGNAAYLPPSPVFWATSVNNGLFYADSRRGGAGGSFYTTAGLQRSAVTGIRAVPGEPPCAAEPDDRCLTIHDPHDRPNRAVVLVDRTIVLFDGSGRSITGLWRGLPDACRPEALRVSGSRQAAFLVRCARDGRTYRLTTSSTVRPPDDPPTPSRGRTPPPGGLPRTPLLPLGVLPVPKDSGRQLAFDGESLLFTVAGTSKWVAAVHRVSTTGMHADRPMPLAGDMRTVTYSWDRPRQSLYLFANADHPMVGGSGTKEPYFYRSGVARFDPRTGATTRLFIYACDPSCRWAYDPTRDDFWLGSELGRTISFVNKRGELTGGCSYTGYGTPYAPIQSGAKPDGARAIVSLGDGTALVDWYDGVTIVRIDRGCRTLGVYSHPPTSSVDSASLACDSATYPVPAVWLRVSDTLLAAFQSPAGLCGSPTRLAVLGRPAIRLGTSADVCARLTFPSGSPLPGQPVSLAVAGRSLGAARTDAAGIACRAYRPPGRPAARPAIRTEPVVATFAGAGAAYDPSRATGEVAVAIPAADPGPRSRPAGNERPPAVVAALPGVAAAPPAPIQLQPQTQPQTQSQGQGQGQANAQQGSQPNAGLALTEQERVQVARERIGDSSLAASRPGDGDAALAAVQCLAGLVAAAATATALRTRTRTRPRRCVL
jgi:hypothetical protein